MSAPGAPDETIVALSSGRPPAGIAIIRVSGPAAHSAGRAMAGDLPAPREAALREIIDPRDGRRLDRALLLRFNGPGSATGDDIVEFHCHGGRAVVDALLEAIAALPGVRVAQPGEFTRRALANGRIDLTEVEGLADLLAAETESQRRAALLVADGGLRRQVEAWRSELLDLSAQAEVAIDYADEEDGRGAASLLSETLGILANSIARLLAAPRIEPLREGLRVVIAGPPNSGKSSLLNAISGIDRAIVTPIAGTTRDSIEVPLAVGGIPFLFVDTAGLRASDDPVEAIGIERAGREVESADILLWLGEPGAAPVHPELVQVLAKSDLGVAPVDGGWPVSALTGDGIAELIAEVARRAANLLPAEGTLALNRRQAELLALTQSSVVNAANSSDSILVAEEIRYALATIDAITGRAGIEEMLDALFARFCLGK